MSKSKKFMIDTSVIIDNPFNLIKLSEGGKNKIFITETVIEELDKHKTSLNDLVAISAREFFRGFNDSSFKKSKLKSKKKGDSIYVVEFKFDKENLEINVIVRTEYEKETLKSESKNDEKIREVSKTYNLKCITNDISFKFKAMSMGLEAESIHWDSIDNFEDINFKFEKTLTEKEFLENKDSIAKELKKWSQLHIHYKDEKTGAKTGKKEFFIVGDNDLINITNNNYDKFEIKPLNLEQKFYLHMLESKFNVLTVSGKTGSGKTLLALQEGMRRVRDKNSDIDGIIYMRFTVNAEDKFSALGYRKGGDEQKLDRFNYPLYSAINFILEKRLKKENQKNEKNLVSIKKNELTEKFIKDYNIEFLDISSARGITIKNKYVIFDEIQNAPNLFIRLIGTRAGENSVFVLMGDPGQVDHPHLSKMRNGLITMLKESMEDKSSYSSGIKLEKTVRSETSKWFENHIES